MTDLYIRREEPSKRPIVIAILVIVLIVIGLLVYHLRNRARATAEVPPVEMDIPESPVDTEPETTASPPAPRDEVRTAPSGTEAGPTLLSEARRLQGEGKLVEARNACLRILGQTTDPKTRAAVEAMAGEIGIQLVFSPHDMPEKELYVVAPGDSLDRIARKYKTTIGLLQKGNDISGALIHPGDRLRVLTGDFSIRISKSRNTLVLYLNDQFLKRYLVGTGAYNKTPLGTFKITDKIAQPPWWRPDGKQIPYGDPENLLGTHWMSLDLRGYGIHGTWEPETIGKQASAGCVRLLNEDIEELFTLVPVGTSVVIED